MSKPKNNHIDLMKFSQIYLLCLINDLVPSVVYRKGEL